MKRITVRVYGPLNDFVPPERRHVSWPHAFEGGASVKDVIEGLGVHYDPRFNPILFAAPIALRMRRRILSSLGDQPARDPNEWVYTLSGVLGAVAGVFTRAGKSFLSRLEAEFEAARPVDIPRIETKRLPPAATEVKRLPPAANQ